MPLDNPIEAAAVAALASVATMAVAGLVSALKKRRNGNGNGDGNPAGEQRVEFWVAKNREVLDTALQLTMVPFMNRLSTAIEKNEHLSERMVELLIVLNEKHEALKEGQAAVRENINGLRGDIGKLPLAVAQVVQARKGAGQ